MILGAAPHFGPSRLMDFELEMAAFVGGPPTALGQRITAKEAEDRIFGLVLMNDWSGMHNFVVYSTVRLLQLLFQ